MKRLLIMAAGLMLMSCAKETQMAEVHFSPIESNTMTRAERADIIRGMVASRLPSTVDLKLTSSKTGTQYETATGQTLRVPIGNYTVYGKTESSKALDFGQLYGSISSTPTIEALQKVALVSGENNLTLKAKFTCFGIVIDRREVERFTVKTMYLTETDVPMEYEGDYGIAFVVGQYKQECRFTIYPKDRENNDPQEVSVVADPLYHGKVMAQPGNYYIFHPTQVEKVDAGIVIETPSMNENDLL